MKRLATVAVLVMLAASIPVAWTRAQSDGNGDGCVDLRDYAIMQSAFTGPACSPSQLRAFFGEGTEEFVVIPSVPGASGIVLTDIMTQRAFPVTVVTLIEEIDGQRTVKASLSFGASSDSTQRGDQRSYHLTTGIPFTAGATVLAQVSNSGLTQVTLCGYTF